MSGQWNRFVAVVLVVIFTGAAHACMCAGMGEVAAAPVSADPHACCKPQGDQAPATPTPDEGPCKNCNAQHPLTISVPEKASNAPAPDFAAVVFFAIELPFIQAFAGPAAHTGTDHIPIPPLLRDLVHTSCQLTL